MSTPTHAAFGGCAYLFVMILAGEKPLPALLALAAVSGLAADLDTSSSMPGRLFSPVSVRLERLAGHRTLTHSLLGATIVGAAFAPLLAWSVDAYASIIAGYLSHTILDSMTVEGVELFYPFSRLRCVFPYDGAAPYRYRVTTGSRADSALAGGFLIMLVPLYLVADSGYERMIRLAQQNILSAVRDYEMLSANRRVAARIRGINRLTGETIDGTFSVVGSRDQHTLIIRDSTGRLRAVGDGDRQDYKALEVICAAGESLRVEATRVDLSGEPLVKAALELESSAEVFLFGDLELEDEPDLVPVDGQMCPVRNSGRTLHLDYASPSDLCVPGLRDCYVRSGVVTALRRFPAASPPPPTTIRVCGILLSREDSIDVLVRETDRLESGDTLARGIRRADVNTADAGNAGRLRTVQRQLARERRAILGDSAELSRAVRLEENGFLSRQAVEEKKNSLRQGRDRVMELAKTESHLLHRNAAGNGPAGLWHCVLRSPVRGVVETLLCTRRGGRPRVIVIIRME